MKLKNIFLSILTVAAFTGCSNEDLVGPEKIDYQGGDVVLMINGSTREDVETKANDKDGDNDKEDGDKDNSEDLLCVFVYDANGKFLGGGKSDETSTAKAQKVADVLYNQNFKDLGRWSQEGNGQSKIAEDINSTSPKDVIVSGKGLVSGEDVDVILIANPTDEIKKAYEEEASLADLNKITADLATQISMYENAGHSTACQRIKINNLARGINYCGKNKYDPANKQGNSGECDWWTEQYSDQIPLYRLISQIRLMEVNVEPSKGTAGFTIEKVYLKQRKYFNTSKFYPDVALSSLGSDFSDNCKLIKNPAVESPSDNLVRVDMGIGVGDLRKLLAINVTSEGAAKYDEICTLVDKNYTVPAKGDKFKDVTQPLYSFDGNSNPILVVVGHYSAYKAGPRDIMKNGEYTKYEVEIKGADDSFHRNYIYNVYLTIKGVGSDPDEEEPDYTGPEPITANIEIANMSEVNPDFVFGEDEE